MLKEFIEADREKRNECYNKKVADHIAHRDKMAKLKAIIEELGDGYIELFESSFEPTQENINTGYSPSLGVKNIGGIVYIKHCQFNEQGEVEFISVSGLNIFPLSGEKHTIETFFKKIAPYLT